MKLSSPRAIQDFLDSTAYSDDPIYRCPARVAAERKAHCVDGALFAASALRKLGHRPRLVDLQAVRDDDHVIAVYQLAGHWGCCAKSNVVGLRFREPVFRTLRELAMSFLELYYNLEAEKTLRSYSVPVDLSRFDRLHWETKDDCIEPVICERLTDARHIPLMSAAQLKRLSRIDPRLYEAGLMGSNPKGLWRNDKPKAPAATASRKRTALGC